MIIIPDIHGRSFWRNAIDKKEKEEKVIFLGDYGDPYEDEGVTVDMAFNEFSLIMEYYLSHQTSTTLLLGNHDLYYFDKMFQCCRHDSDYKRWNRFFTKYSNDFRIAVEIRENGTNYLITHAGVHIDWLNDLFRVWPLDKDIPLDLYINNLYYYHWEKFRYNLSQFSYYRGFSPFSQGSCIWADLEEWKDEERINRIYQIFGHSLRDEPIINKFWACLDTRMAFRINKGIISKI